MNSVDLDQWHLISVYTVRHTFSNTLDTSRGSGIDYCIRPNYRTVRLGEFFKITRNTKLC